MSEVKRLPVGTLALIAASLGGAFAVAIAPNWADALAFDVTHPSFLAALTSLFLHANLIHLLGNMIFLAAVGPAVEFATGSARYFAIYFLGGLSGVALHWALTKNVGDAPPLMGASGAIASCVAYFSVRYFTMRVPLAPNLTAPLWSVAGLWLLLQALGAALRIGSEVGGVSFWAHMGGFAAGLALSLLFRAPKLANVQFGHEALDRMNQRGPAAALIVAERHLAEHPNDPRALAEVADAHHELGHPKEEIAAWLQYLATGSETALQTAVQRLGALQALDQVSPIKRLRLAESLSKKSPESSQTLLQSVVAMPDSEPQKPDAMLALAELWRERSDARSEATLDALAEKFPLHAATELARARGWLA